VQASALNKSSAIHEPLNSVLSFSVVLNDAVLSSTVCLNDAGLPCSDSLFQKSRNKRGEAEQEKLGFMRVFSVCSNVPAFLEGGGGKPNFCTSNEPRSKCEEKHLAGTTLIFFLEQNNYI
jgi:hypothetical protein